MDLNNFSGIEELLKYLGYEKITEEDDDELTESNKSSNESDTSNCKCKIDPTAGASTNWYAKLNLDIPGGILRYKSNIIYNFRRSYRKCYFWTVTLQCC